MLKMKSLGLALLLCAPLAQANEAVIRKNLTERLPNLPKIDEVRAAAFPGLWEIRIGNEIRYTDPTGSYLIEGELIDVKSRPARNLTAERVDKLNQIDFAALPLKDAVVWKSGNGKRRIAVFADPNCGYCKRFERSLQDVKDITVYTFLIPILGGDSPDKSRAIWCAKDSTATWMAWMLEGKTPPKPAASCDDAAIERNLALARKHQVNGTPAVIFEDGSRAPGAISAEQLERRLAASKS
ncbi:DsbC family protein [Paucibacter sp. O1-1]|uniref:DsbC family protein n=1 Tax=unclassified Roseateles TaxID=2626991 RepID=UPI0010F91DD7|nr:MULTISPECIES: DsbC family protein [unclassified Roseateles]MCU7373377.1 DsbC family protein [Paucibacter sp. O1-1]MCZ7879668.1 DsbC family protein [Paucibacter sp. M5-1]MDA3828376.1 DsbC family protein [Paucibacter sp. O1-1]MDC6169987.1 DsbC family protein [Paucibacter sp. XJ19-41]